MEDVITAIDKLLAKLAHKKLMKESLEWYLCNNLNNYKNALLKAVVKQDVEYATRAFTRFCTESMEWDTELFNECSNLQKLGRRLTKN